MRKNAVKDYDYASSSYFFRLNQNNLITIQKFIQLYFKKEIKKAAFCGDSFLLFKLFNLKGIHKGSCEVSRFKVFVLH